MNATNRKWGNTFKQVFTTKLTLKDGEWNIKKHHHTFQNTQQTIKIHKNGVNQSQNETAI